MNTIKTMVGENKIWSDTGEPTFAAIAEGVTVENVTPQPLYTGEYTEESIVVTAEVDDIEFEVKYPRRDNT